MADRSWTAAWRATAVVLLLVAVACLLRWSDASTPASARASATTSVTGSTDAGTTTDAARQSTRGARTDRRPARPVTIGIPSIDVTSRLVGLGLNADGTVEVPTDPDRAGWYELGTRPGALGSAVVLGHVDSDQGPAVFALLRTLVRGDVVDVGTADGGSESFRVQSVRTYPNDRFPARLVYAAHGVRVLNLVTCGGSYDAARGGYQANVVVRARWVDDEER